jgi:hypothetical protein
LRAGRGWGIFAKGGGRRKASREGTRGPEKVPDTFMPIVHEEFHHRFPHLSEESIRALANWYIQNFVASGGPR